MRKTVKCRNCGAAITSEDIRYECPRCGFRYIIAGNVMLEPERQRQEGVPKISIMVQESGDNGKD